jgi:hypothetical protein
MTQVSEHSLLRVTVDMIVAPIEDHAKGIVHSFKISLRQTVRCAIIRLGCGLESVNEELILSDLPFIVTQVEGAPSSTNVLEEWWMLVTFLSSSPDRRNKGVYVNTPCLRDTKNCCSREPTGTHLEILFFSGGGFLMGSMMRGVRTHPNHNTSAALSDYVHESPSVSGDERLFISLFFCGSALMNAPFEGIN